MVYKNILHLKFLPTLRHVHGTPFKHACRLFSKIIMLQTYQHCSVM